MLARPDPVSLERATGEGQTMMLQNLPVSVRQKDLIEVLAMDFLGTFDFLYIPTVRQEMSRGHAFVNFTRKDHAEAFKRRYHGKRCDHRYLRVTLAKVQGLELNHSHLALKSVMRGPAENRPIFLREVAASKSVPRHRESLIDKAKKERNAKQQHPRSLAAATLCLLKELDSQMLRRRAARDVDIFKGYDCDRLLCCALDKSNTDKIQHHKLEPDCPESAVKHTLPVGQYQNHWLLCEKCGHATEPSSTLCSSCLWPLLDL